MTITTRVTTTKRSIVSKSSLLLHRGGSSRLLLLLLLLIVLVSNSTASTEQDSSGSSAESSMTSTPPQGSTTTTITTTMTPNTNNDDETVQSTKQKKKKKVLVVGATGNTGKHVVQFLLDQGHFVTVLARSKDKMYQVLSPAAGTGSSSTPPPPPLPPNDEWNERLTVIEAAVLDLTNAELKDITSDKDAIVSCLGHAGIYSEPKRLVRDAVMRLTTAMPTSSTTTTTATCKFILLSASGVVHTNHDPIRHWLDRVLLFLIRMLVPPHADNEEAAEYLYQHGDSIPNWVVVRPTDLVDAAAHDHHHHDHREVSSSDDYDTYPSPMDRLFSGDYVASRINVAHFMAELSVNDTLSEQWNQKMPVFYDKKKKTSEEASSNKEL